ncbi:unnamed protein product [Bursaphelenchus xylophilus]|uniref:(pine wood nematode) hypothetical protein n=1 Tax=Bursaphelenchus xylophilus TaxID=6326 RepID=A0A1I7SAL7_BURXY|nr:unnamed protein product [Bursaphelenchus xylophilus]CAG9079217.1 unnamed protein product [Bursaphelenchus xylophilus]
MLATFSFTSPDLEIAGFFCLKDFGACQKYCDTPQFCRLYCNPLCCTSKLLRELRCTRFVPNAYRMNSTEFEILPQPWKTADGESIGVYAEDLIVFKGGASNAEMELGKTRNKVGLRRRSFNESFVNDLYIAGIIPEPILSIGYSHHPANRAVTFGRHVREHCGEYNKIDLTNRLEFMFDGIDVVFMSYTESQNFRIGLSESDTFHAPHYALTRLLHSKIISFKKESGYVYFVNTKQLQNFTWTLSDGFRIDLQDYNVIREYHVARIIYILPISPNPDNMQWILSSAVFFEYCI